MIRAVIFDMDGLLVDSEGVGLDVMRQCGRMQGYDLPLPMIRSTLGSAMAPSCALYERHFPGIDTRRLFADFVRRMHLLAEEGKVPLKKGALSLLDDLKARGIPCAVASSSGPDTIRLYLEKAGVYDAFSVIVAANASRPSKPAPDIFLEAAEKLGVPPQHCLVLEDSVNGVKAGRAAGMQVAMVPDQIPFSESLRPYCDHVLADLTAVTPLLAP